MMDYFWYSRETIPAGVGFKLYDKTHLGWLFAMLITFAVCCVLYRFLSESNRLKFRRTIALLMVIVEIFKHIILVINGVWQLNYLPLHLCSISIFFSCWHAIKPNALNRELLYALCMPGALMALLFPSWTMLPCMNGLSIHSFAIHILLVMYPLPLLFCGELRPNVKNLPKCLLFLVILGIPMFFLNKAWNTNFMYLNWADAGNPLFLFEKLLGRPWYIVGFIPLISLVWFLLYYPWVKAAKKQN